MAKESGEKPDGGSKSEVPVLASEDHEESMNPPVSAEQVLLELKKIDGLLRHLRLVQQGAEILGKKLIESGEIEFGKTLIANSMLHDQSKFRGIEWDAISNNCVEVNDDTKRLAIQNHAVTNSHHPEYWGGINNQPRIMTAEMVCDWYARSVEFGTDLRVWVRDVAVERFGISKNGKKWKEIQYFLNLLLDKPF